MTKKILAFFSRISIRLLTFNVLIVFLPVAALLYLDTYEHQLLRSLENALIQQGRILASALAGQESLDSGTVEAILLRLEQRHEARLRVVDRAGRLLADSSRLGPRSDEIAGPGKGLETAAGQPARQEAIPAQQRSLYLLATYPVRLYRRLFQAPEPPLESAEFYINTDILLGPEIREALAGGYGAMTRISSGGQRSVTLYSAVPIRRDGQVAGAVLVSQSTYRILRDLYELRLEIFTVFLLSLAVAVVLSLLLATTIAVPVRRLRLQAREILDQRGRLRGHIRFNRRRDEIGDLSRSLEEMTRKLHSHVRFVESFASDVSHELKNPLASIRSASEMISRAETPEQRSRFLTVIQREVSRLQQLLGALREISLIDAQLDREERTAVAVDELLDSLIEAQALRSEVRIVRAAGGSTATDNPSEIKVSMAPERLAQVLENLLENAVSFSPPGAEVSIRLSRDNGQAIIRFEDQGPGIPEQHLERIFDRFFSFRPAENPGRHGRSHLGLGLAIVKAIVDGYGGQISAGNRPEGGACFEVRLPLCAS